MTGLATGPHLDFRIELRGQFLNFERLPLLPSDPVAGRDWAAFVAARDQALPEMPSVALHQTTVAANASPSQQTGAR